MKLSLSGLKSLMELCYIIILELKQTDIHIENIHGV